MSKLDNVRKAMGSKLDAILLYDETNQYYFTEFKFSDGAVLITKDKSYLITDFRYRDEAMSAVSDEWSVVVPSDRTEFIKDVLSKEKCNVVGIEENELSYSKCNNLKKTFDDVSFRKRIDPRNNYLL